MLESLLIAMSLLSPSFGNELNRIIRYEYERPLSCSSFIDLKIPNDRFDVVNTSMPLTPKNVLEASRRGIIPYNEARGRVQWTRFKDRGILDFAPLLLYSNPGHNMFDESDDPMIRADRTMILRAKKRMEDDARLGRPPKFVISKSEDFDNVIEACARQPRYVRAQETKNWISKDFVRVYKDLNRQGYAYARGLYVNGKLVAGFYGLVVNGSISGESMFHDAENGGKNGLKFLLVEFVEEMYALGHRDMDTQVVAALIKKYGGYLMENQRFMLRNARLRANPPPFPDLAEIARVAAE